MGVLLDSLGYAARACELPPRQSLREARGHSALEPDETFGVNDVSEPPVHGTATAHLANVLREAIVRGEFPPGTRIRQEQLAAFAGASRAPVREALRMLAAEGLVTLVANSGARVSSLSLSECEEIYRRSEELRVGKEGGSTCRIRGSPYH